MLEETKFCGHCERDLPLSAFSKNRTNKSGLSNWCRPCNKEYSARWRKLNGEYLKKYRQINAEHRHKISNSWRKKNLDYVRDKKREWYHKKGLSNPFDQSRECSLFLGVHVAERVLAALFHDVQRMPLKNPGYDFICSRGLKIDVKCSARLQRKGRSDRWTFGIDSNKIADYFLLLAFDNRDSLNPEHIWIVPSGLVNDHLGSLCLSDNPKTLTKWAKYERPIDKVVDCCNQLKAKAAKIAEVLG